MTQVRWVLVLASAMTLFSLVAQNAAQAAEGKRVLSSQTGRYVFGQISDFRVDQYMLDTQTGKLWQLACISNPSQSASEPAPTVGCNGYSVLQPVPYESANGKFQSSAP